MSVLKSLKTQIKFKIILIFHFNREKIIKIKYIDICQCVGKSKKVKFHMTIKALDDGRIRRFLEPWLEKKGKKMPVLADAFVKSILLRAAKVDTDRDKLHLQLEPFLSIAQVNTKHFIHKFKKQIEKIREKDLRDFQQDKKQNIQQKPTNIPQKPQLFNRTPQKPQIPKIQYPKPQMPPVQKPTYAPTTTVPPRIPNSHQIQPKAPSFFLSTSQISLRASDQNQQKLRLNEKGEQIDEQGNVIKQTRFNKSEKPAKVPYDKRIPTAVKPLNREFKFIPQGVVSKEIEAKREEVKIDIAVASGLPIFDVIALKRNYEIPDVDWWDAPYIIADDKDNWQINENAEVDASFENCEPIKVKQLVTREIPTMLTQEERDRMNHLKKLEKANQERLMIKLNLKEPEPPRVKPQTMISFNSGEAFLKPTEVENRTREAAEKRQKAHKERNLENMLTPEEKREKKYRKIQEDADKNTIQLTYVLRSLKQPLNIATILNMGGKHSITGGLFYVKYPEKIFIVAECGEKAARKFKALVQNRLKWDQEGPEGQKMWDLAFESTPLPHQRCFGNFRKYVFDALTQCQKFFIKYNAQHLFDPATNTTFE